MTPLPPQPYLPGRTPRPAPGFFAPLLAALPGPDPEALATSAAFRAGFDAFDARYYWEAHEMWEPVWAALPPAAAERQLLRGLIQLANAGLKRRLGRGTAALRIVALADAALAEAYGPRRDRVMGLDRAQVAAMRAQVLAESAL